MSEDEKQIIKILLNELLCIEDGFTNIIKSLFLFKEFRNLLDNKFVNSELGSKLIGSFKCYETYGITSKLFTIKDFGAKYDNENLKPHNFLYHLLKILILESENNDKLENIQTYGLSNHNFVNEMSLKQIIYNMFPIMNDLDEYITSVFMKEVYNREFFINYVILGDAKKLSWKTKYRVIKRTYKTFHVFYVSYSKENDRKILKRSDLPKLYTIWLDGDYKLKSFHAIWLGNSGIERISCYRKNDIWYSFDFDYIVNENLVSHLLCDGICDLHLFYGSLESN